MLEVPVDPAREGWVMVRVTDLTEPPDPRATAPDESFGRAIAYGSPWFIERRHPPVAGGANQGYARRDRVG